MDDNKKNKLFIPAYKDTEITIPRLSGAEFLFELHEQDNYILCEPEELRKKAVGWAFSSSTTYPKNNGVSEYLALMIEDSDDSFRKYWVHIDPLVFEMNFLKEYLDKRGISYEKAERMD